MTLSVIDLASIGATTGFTTFLAMYATMTMMKRRDTKRKIIVMEEMLSKMHDQAKTEFEFDEIVGRLKRGEVNDN